MNKISIDIAREFSSLSLTKYFLEKIKNKSGRGVDGVDTREFEKSILEITLKIPKKIEEEKYRFTPYSEIIRSKGRNKEPRVIAKPSIRDKLTLGIVKNILHAAFPEAIGNKLPNNYIREIRGFLENADKPESLSFIKIDIKNFYGAITQIKLLEKLSNRIDTREFITLIRRSLVNETIPKNYKKKDREKYVQKTGVPQGLSISNILANIYVLDFDTDTSKLGLKYFRYVDDILLIVDKEKLSTVKEEVIASLRFLDLDANDKSDEGLLTEAFEYLGYKIAYPKISIRESTVDRFINAVIAIFSDYKYNSKRWIRKSKWLKLENVKEIFLLKLNEKITGAISDNKRYGWVFYFIEINDIQLLHKIDAIVRALFARLDDFNNKPPLGLKSIVKTYYAAKYDTFGGYIHNYNSYETIEDKIGYLVRFGYIPEYDIASYSEAQIEAQFHWVKGRHLMKLDHDVGNIS